MLLAQIKANRSQILALGEKYGAKNIRIFGSVARGEERPDSGVDFLVEFPLGYDLIAQRIPMTYQLSELLHRPVVLIPEHELNRYIRDQVLSEAVTL